MNYQSVLGVLGKVAGISSLLADTTFTAYIDQLFGANGTKIIAGLGIIAFTAGEISHILGVQTVVNNAVVASSPVPSVPPITDASHTD
jgi:hypothetical protein